MKIDDFIFVQKSGYVFFVKKIGQDLSHNLYFEIFLCFLKVFLNRRTRQVTLVSSEEMQSSYSGSINMAVPFFFEVAEEKILISLSLTIIFS